VAFDDPTVPCYAPVWAVAIPLILATLDRAGIPREGVTLLCANALHRQFTVYLNASTTRGFSGGWKSVCVGLSSYRSIRHHHTPDTMSMSTEKNRMHEVLDRMGAVVDRELGGDRIFKLETVLSNPLQVHRVFGGTVAATRGAVLELTRAHQPARRDILPDKVDEPALIRTTPTIDRRATGPNERLSVLARAFTPTTQYSSGPKRRPSTSSPGMP
jgi:nickel-dependent lactate racemase